MTLFGFHRPWALRIRAWCALLSVSVFAVPVLALAMRPLANPVFMAEAGADARGNASLAARRDLGWLMGRSNVFAHAALEIAETWMAHAEVYGLTAISPDPTESLAPGASRRFELPAVLQSTLFTEPMYRIDVPENAVSLTIDVGSCFPSWR